MQTILDSVDRPAHDAFIEKKSEFIGDACHIESLDDALAFVQTIRDLHPKARHVAYAAVCGGSGGRLAERMSDDGEPSGTAGKPILDVLRANEMTDCVVAVTRYFGGILLGSGGLIRAYSTGASIATIRSSAVSRTYWRRWRASRLTRSTPTGSYCPWWCRWSMRASSRRGSRRRSTPRFRRSPWARPTGRSGYEAENDESVR